MKDITDIVHRYRLALRYVWNTCYWTDLSRRNWESVDSFRTLKVPLFMAVVNDALGLEKDDYLFGPGFIVTPSSGAFSSLQFNARNPTDLAGGIWGLPIGPVRGEGIQLTLLDLFDWTHIGYIDLRYYKARVDYCEKYPDMVGHEALVDVTEASVFWSGSAAEA